MAGSFKFDFNALMHGISVADMKARTALLMYGDTAAKKMQGWMRSDAVWTDRTGDARKRLTGEASEVRNGIQIALAHGVDYGVWLEFAMEQRYAIIEPTIRLRGPEVLQGYQGLIDSLGVGK